MTQAAILAASGSPGTTTGFKNRIINGAMGIAQRGTSFTGLSTDGTYTLDRWFYAMNGGGAMSSAQSSTAPAGFVNSILSTVTTADGTVSSGSYYQLRQAIEGLNCTDLAWGTADAKTVTVSFWVNSSVTGTYTFSLRNTGGAVSYITTYSISAANTWTKITITVPGPTSGTWLTTNGVGIFATWDFGTGSPAVTSTTNSWISGNYTGATGATKLINTNGATFYLTGVQLEVGTTATNFDFRSYGTELSLCQRYYAQNLNPSIGGIGTASSFVTTLRFPVPMRTTPTMSVISGMTPTIDLFGVGSATASSNTFDSLNFSSCRYYCGGMSGSTFGQPSHLNNNSVQASAEL